VLPLRADPPHVRLRPLPHGVAQRALPVGHATEVHLGGPAEVDLLPFGLLISRRASSRAAGLYTGFRGTGGSSVRAFHARHSKGQRELRIERDESSASCGVSFGAPEHATGAAGGSHAGHAAACACSHRTIQTPSTRGRLARLAGCAIFVRPSWRRSGIPGPE